MVNVTAHRPAQQRSDDSCELEQREALNTTGQRCPANLGEVDRSPRQGSTAERVDDDMGESEAAAR